MPLLFCSMWKDSADITEDITADDADRLRGKVAVGSLQAEVVHAHGAGGPDHGDEALEGHHPVEGRAALALALHRAGDDGGLSGVEAGQYAAGDRYEEDRQEVLCGEVALVVDRGAVDHADPGIPQLDQRIALREDADEHADSGEEQDGAEYRVNAADDGVDREHGCDEVVKEDDTVDDPRGPVGCLAGEVEHLGCRYVARGVDEHRADKEQQHAQEDVIDREDTLVGVLLDHVWHLCAAVAQADHAAEVVVHGAADDVADGDGYEGKGPEEDALDGPYNGAGARNVEQVYQAVLPAPHGHVVDAVLLGVSRSLTVVRTKDMLAELAVQRGAADQNDQADDKGIHKLTLLLVLFLSYKALKIPAADTPLNCHRSVLRNIGGPTPDAGIRVNRPPGSAPRRAVMRML